MHLKENNTGIQERNTNNYIKKERKHYFSQLHTEILMLAALHM